MKHLTHSTKPVSEKDIKRLWHLVDLSGAILGRTAPQIAKFLQGKHKATFSQNIDSGDYVVVVNAQKVEMTGKKMKSKTYTYYSGYPGGLKIKSFETLRSKNPSELIRHVVSGMLPKNKLRDQRLSRLFVFADDKHPYADKLTK